MSLHSKTLARLASLLGTLQDRLQKLQDSTDSNRLDDIRWVSNQMDELRRAQREVNVLAHGDVIAREKELKAEIDTLKVQSDSANRTLLDRIKEVAFENDKREEAQTLRDQNNVKGLTDLRDSAKKGFEDVATDVKQLFKLIGLLQERVTNLENPADVPAPAPSAFDPAGFAPTPTSSARWEIESAVNKIVNSEGHCTDSACMNKVFAAHFFGPGCRFYSDWMLWK